MMTIIPTTKHTLQETADALGMSVDQVLKTERRAIAKLRRDEELRVLAKEAGILREGTTLCTN